MTRISKPPPILEARKHATLAASWWPLPIALTLSVIFWNISAPSRLFSDYLKAYYPAGRSLWSTDYNLEELYQSVTFVNIPIFSIVLTPFSAITPPAMAAAAFLAAGILATVIATWMLCSFAKHRRPIQLATIITLVLVNGPLIYSLREGNTTHFLLLIFAVYIASTGNRSSYTGGFIVRVASLIKLPLIPAAPQRRRFRSFGGIDFKESSIMHAPWRSTAAGRSFVGQHAIQTGDSIAKKHG
ncbi:glycosyltransferase 87 family protein [Kaistia terrae]|uniref:Glycosyltransferase 87 family protein n=1 Tax=Kaistia terrae TaxID=537017 RepID=A0ABW0Q1Y9_9HYPH|nr:glycosyltransferase 87 family protein [Kaistia terrae]MCX5578951.1 glycosyltransferase 87 family protein [Kaistia terrae]